MSTNTEDKGVLVHCGWGRLIFAHTFPNPETVANAVLAEEPGQRDIAFYLNDPHLVLNQAPQDLFLDPSNTYRLHLDNYEPSDQEPVGFTVSRLKHKEEIDAINRIYTQLGMVGINADYVWEQRDSDKIMYVLARDEQSGKVLGAALGVDHLACFDDIFNGCSLWSLAVDPQAELPGVGQAIVRHIIEEFKGRGRGVLDLSVMHDNDQATKLYKKLHFEKVAVFAVKRRNSINEKLFTGEKPDDGYNPYATIIINEAMRRGISVDPLDPERGYFRLSLGGRVINCRESLSDLTTAIAFSRCDDKQVTRDLLKEAGLGVPEQIAYTEMREAIAFLNKHKSVVVKPAQGEQGNGVFVDIRTQQELKSAIEEAGKFCDVILIEQCVDGDDLRIIVIQHEVVAAAIRKPAEVVGTGEHTIEELIERLSRRRSAATGGESTIPMDGETMRCIEMAGFALDTVLQAGESLRVRRTANLHTGGTIHDVTPQLNARLANAAIRAAHALEIPVVGLDFIVPDVTQDRYVIIEANERPGLANHEPQPTAEKFIDLLFPHTAKPAGIDLGGRTVGGSQNGTE